jgi:hypothetical protein
MGGSGYGINGGLYGHKSALLDALRDNDVPVWLSADHPERGGGVMSIRATEPANDFLRKWRQVAREERRKTLIAFAVKGAPETRIRSSQTRYRGRSGGRHSPKAPASIRERCEEYVDSWTHKETMAGLHDHTGRFDGFVVTVEIGERGGINDAHLSAEYSH